MNVLYFRSLFADFLFFLPIFFFCLLIICFCLPVVVLVCPFFCLSLIFFSVYQLFVPFLFLCTNCWCLLVTVLVFCMSIGIFFKLFSVYQNKCMFGNCLNLEYFIFFGLVCLRNSVLIQVRF